MRKGKKKRYVARTGAPFHTGDAQLIGECLDSIAVLHGGILRTADVVIAAEHKHHPLHKFFEWDVSEAARLYHLQQARNLVNHVVEVVVVGGVSQETRSFVSVTEKDSGQAVYVTINELVNNRNYLVEYLSSLQTELTNAVQTIGLLKHFLSENDKR